MTMTSWKWLLPTRDLLKNQPLHLQNPSPLLLPLLLQRSLCRPPPAVLVLVLVQALARALALIQSLILRQFVGHTLIVFRLVLKPRRVASAISTAKWRIYRRP